MAVLPTMPVHTDAILADTGDLPNELFGAYCRMLFRWWREGARPEPDLRRLARWARLSSAEFEDLKEFLTETEAGWVQRKLQETYASVLTKSAKARAAANARHSLCERNASAMRPQCENGGVFPQLTTVSDPTHADASKNGADAMRTHTKTDADAMLSKAKAILEDKSSKKEVSAGVGEDFWLNYPHPDNRGPKSAVIGKVNSLSEEDQANILASLEPFRRVIEAQRKKIPDYQAPMAATFVNQRRWESILESRASRSGSSQARVPVHPDPECAEKWEALRAALGEAVLRSWFLTDEAPTLKKNGAGFVIAENSPVRIDRIKQQFKPALDEIFGKGQWRIEAPP